MGKKGKSKKSMREAEIEEMYTPIMESSKMRSLNSIENDKATRNITVELEMALKPTMEEIAGTSSRLASWAVAVEEEQREVVNHQPRITEHQVLDHSDKVHKFGLKFTVMCGDLSLSNYRLRDGDLQF